MFSSSGLFRVLSPGASYTPWFEVVLFSGRSLMMIRSTLVSSLAFILLIPISSCSFPLGPNGVVWRGLVVYGERTGPLHVYGNNLAFMPCREGRRDCHWIIFLPTIVFCLISLCFPFALRLACVVFFFFCPDFLSLFSVLSVHLHPFACYTCRTMLLILSTMRACDAFLPFSCLYFFNFYP